MNRLHPISTRSGTRAFNDWRVSGKKVVSIPEEKALRVFYCADLMYKSNLAQWLSWSERRQYSDMRLHCERTHVPPLHSFRYLLISFPRPTRSELTRSLRQNWWDMPLKMPFPRFLSSLWSEWLEFLPLKIFRMFKREKRREDHQFFKWWRTNLASEPLDQNVARWSVEANSRFIQPRLWGKRQWEWSQRTSIGQSSALSF